MTKTINAYLPKLPLGVGVGFKAQHFEAILDNPGDLAWIEIHAENYMGQGGRPLAQLRELSEIYPVSCHGVGLSIGGETPLDPEHLDRLKTLIGWLKPTQFSEHLAWSSHGQNFYNDLLPVPYTKETVARVKDHINQVQETLNTQMLLENPSNYLAFAESDMSEVEFLKEITANTGCGLLLDINNVYVSAVNQQTNPQAYIDDFPLQAVGEFHLGGHEGDVDDAGNPLLIDSHSRPVINPVWALYDYALSKAGPRPTLIEWDNDVPDWPDLKSEVSAAHSHLSARNDLAAQ